MKPTKKGARQTPSIRARASAQDHPNIQTQVFYLSSSNVYGNRPITITCFVLKTIFIDPSPFKFKCYKLAWSSHQRHTPVSVTGHGAYLNNIIFK
jgi:hypothetical protein